jgi:hypothetical protein
VTGIRIRRTSVYFFFYIINPTEFFSSSASDSDFLKDKKKITLFPSIDTLRSRNIKQVGLFGFTKMADDSEHEMNAKNSES